MTNINPYKSFFTTILFFVGMLTIIYLYFPKFFDSDFSVALVTFLVGVLVIYLYIKQQEDNKKDAAKIILQEIRRAENIIYDFKEHKQFKFTKKIIATNSWSKNIHHFVDELSIDELDKISNLYSTGEYLDSVIKMVSDTKFDKKMHDNYARQAIEQVRQQIYELNNHLSLPVQNIEETTSNIQQSNQQAIKPLPKTQFPTNIKVNLQYDSIDTDILFMDIVGSYEPIYNSTICLKLKKIAEIK